MKINLSGNKKKISLLAISVLLNVSLNSYAVVAPPSNVDPGAVIKSINSQNYKQELTKEKSNEIPVNAPKVEGKEIPAVLKTVRFKLNKVNFSGNTIFPADKFEKFTTEYIGKDVSIAELKNIAQKITDIYADNGYITSYAYIPPQKVAEGIVEIAILEGKVGKINIEGNKWSRATYLRNNVLKANNLKEENIFNVNNLRKSLGELNDADYLKGQVVLQEGASSDLTDITLKVKDRAPIDLGVSWDNTGRDLIGIQAATISLGNENLTGFGDSLSVSTSFARRTFGLGTDYSIPVGPYGTRFNLGYSQSNYKLGGIYNEVFTGNSYGFNTGLIQPIINNDKFRLFSELDFDLTHSNMRFLDDQYSKYETRVLRFGLNGVFDDNYGSTISRIQVSTGLPIMGGSTSLYVNGDRSSGYGVATGKFVKLNSSLIRVHSLPYRTTGIFRIAGQYSPDTLLPIEQMQLGGMNTVRGFDEGILLGDCGYNLSFELRKSIPYLPNFEVPYWPGRTVPVNLKDRIQFAAFYDQGFAKVVHQQESENYRNFLQSVGVGLRCFVSKYITANFDLGIPIGKERYDSQNAVRFHFSVSSNLL